MTYRVIQWYTGDIASRQMRYLATRPDMELVGAVVHHPEKVGREVGELVGVDGLNVAAIDDVDRALAIEADCVLFNSLSWDPELAARILRSGKNVIALRGGWYPHNEPEYDMLEKACQEGGVSIMGTGNMPGLINEAIPLFAAGYTRDVSRIRTWQYTSPVAYSTPMSKGQAGIGSPVSDLEDPATSKAIPFYHRFLREPAYQVAAAFGRTLDRFELTRWKVGAAPEDFYIAAKDMTVKKGTAAGFEAEFTGFVDGEPFYTHTVQHSWCFGIGPGWRDRTDQPEWVVEIDGSPSLRVQMETLGGPDPWKSANVLELNAARMVNLIPAVCAAPPGCRTPFEMPLATLLGPAKLGKENAS